MQPNQHYWYPSLHMKIILCAHCGYIIAEKDTHKSTDFECSRRFKWGYYSKSNANIHRKQASWDWVGRLEDIYQLQIEDIDPSIADLHYTISESANYVNEQAYVKTFKKTLVFMNEAKALRENPPIIPPSIIPNEQCYLQYNHFLRISKNIRAEGVGLITISHEEIKRNFYDKYSLAHCFSVPAPYEMEMHERLVPFKPIRN